MPDIRDLPEMQPSAPPSSVAVWLMSDAAFCMAVLAHMAANTRRTSKVEVSCQLGLASAPVVARLEVIPADKHD